MISNGAQQPNNKSRYILEVFAIFLLRHSILTNGSNRDGIGEPAHITSKQVESGGKATGDGHWWCGSALPWGEVFIHGGIVD